ncbi:zinc finger BED domain-containing protein 4-like [Homarus americanus]|uniref:zinc finger BED domain-containing protein 4-like n=1 Tax=Homarus americanus TaxID=6706 RepID=UPI001C47F754|nr:zinc finger BED domain-containing protein 4-like [Homarus americanus]
MPNSKKSKNVVDDKGFKRLVSALDPRYELPSRRELTRTHLPNIYDQEVKRVKKELENTNAVSETDIWTSRATKGFITVTAHFISPTWELKSVVLETIRMQEARTAANIAEELTTTCNNRNILNKVCSVVTDNAANITSAVNNIMKLRHLPCFAHTLNLVARDSIENTEEVKHLQEKVKQIVTYFHHRVKASDKLSKLQEHHGVPVKKLIQDVETRWNSTYYMMQRFVQESQLITTTLYLTGRNDMCLNNEELELITKTVAVLEPFEQATREMSADKFTSLSKIIPMVKGLQDHMHSSEDKEVHQLYRTFPLGPYIKMRRYMEESPIPRKEDPLEWWKKHAALCSKLHEQAKMFLCSPASSVPSERLFF